MPLQKITVAYGDGIGPEIMTSALHILREGGAEFETDTIQIGKSVYERGFSSGIEPESWASLRENRVFLKSPITTPQGSGYKSLNVTIRKSLGLYANVRPCVAYAPFVKTLHPGMDVVVVRENEEDLYAGIEHRQTQQVTQCLKLITTPGSEKIIRYAFEYALQNGRKKVTCFSKDNIMKVTDGLFHEIFNEIAVDYPEIESDHMIVDIATARLADTPERFDVIVTTNLYGDIISDVAAQIAGSVGLAGSSNVGQHGAMFEAIHGSAPDIAGKGISNPSGLILAGVMMLNHMGQHDAAERVHNAWLTTIEQGIHTADIYSSDTSKVLAGTDEFTKEVVARMGCTPENLTPVRYSAENKAKSADGSAFRVGSTIKKEEKKELVGVDIFLDWNSSTPDILAELLTALNTNHLNLKMITNRGVKVWPNGIPETFCTDHWRCRFMPPAEGTIISHDRIVEMFYRIAAVGLDFIKSENLYTFDGKPGFALGQGQ